MMGSLSGVPVRGRMVHPKLASDKILQSRHFPLESGQRNGDGSDGRTAE